MGSDYFDTDQEVEANLAKGLPPVGIGSGSVIEGAILDKNCRVGENVVVKPLPGVESSDDCSPLVIRDGIPVLLKDATLPDNWKIS